jgi:arylsulfatase A-like enzyme
VILTSDHGESLGEHGESTHGLFLYDATARVPLIVAAPAVAAGRRIAAPVSLVDVLPTVLELAGVSSA